MKIGSLIVTMLAAVLLMDWAGEGKASTIEGDPLSETIAQYSPAQLKEIIGKTEPQDVTDLFLLLPDTDFLLYFNFTVEQRKELIQKGKTAFAFTGGDIELEMDVENGYLASGYEGGWEMFAKKVDGVWWIAVYENNCGEYCGTIQAKTYTFDAGKLVRHEHANLAGYQDVWLELFFGLRPIVPGAAEASKRNLEGERDGCRAVQTSARRQDHHHVHRSRSLPGSRYSRIRRKGNHKGNLAVIFRIKDEFEGRRMRHGQSCRTWGKHPPQPREHFDEGRNDAGLLDFTY
jgi:hypothetical protein